jgi:hypothetical protein
VADLLWASCSVAFRSQAVIRPTALLLDKSAYHTHCVIAQLDMGPLNAHRRGPLGANKKASGDCFCCRATSDGIALGGSHGISFRRVEGNGRSRGYGRKDKVRCRSRSAPRRPIAWPPRVHSVWKIRNTGRVCASWKKPPPLWASAWCFLSSRSCHSQTRECGGATLRASAPLPALSSRTKHKIDGTVVNGISCPKVIQIRRGGFPRRRPACRPVKCRVRKRASTSPSAVASRLATGRWSLIRAAAMGESHTR